MIISVLGILTTLSGTPQPIYTFPYKTEAACKSAQESLVIAGKFELGSICHQIEMEQWIDAKHQGWVLGMVLVNEQTGKHIGSPSETPMSSQAECETGLVQGQKSAREHKKQNIAFFCFNSTQR